MEAMEEASVTASTEPNSVPWLSRWDIWILISFIVSNTLVILYDMSAKFRYYFKFAIYVIVCSVTALFIIPPSLIRPRHVKNVLMGIPFVKPISKIVGIHWEVVNKDILAKDFPCVIVCNHQSAWDFMLIVELWQVMEKCACVAKRAIMYVFPFGWSAWLSGTVYINRSNPGECKTLISASAQQIQETKTKLWIFPEGTRSKRANLLPFKKGAFHIAVQNKLPIVPVVVSPYTFINDEKKIFNTGKVLVKVLPPIDTSTVTPDGISKLVENCWELMNNEYHKLTQTVQKIAGKDAVHSFAPSRESKSNVSFPNGDRRS